MAIRKGWSELTPAYRKRLSSHGITAAQYKQGVSIVAARGHAYTPEHGGPSYIKQAVGLGVTDVVKVWEDLTPTQQRDVAKRYVHLFDRGKGRVLTKDEQRWVRGDGTKNGVYRHASDQQIRDRMDFNQLLRELDPTWDSSDWAAFGDAYKESFNSAA